MVAALKTLHIVGLMFWCAGLLALPVLFAQRNRNAGPEELHALHRATRALFINVASPAAFFGVAAGTALIFFREVFTVWMALKLLAVGALVILHARDGYVVINLFESDGRYSRLEQCVTFLATLLVILAILWLVLAKPPIGVGTLPDWLRTPGGLQSLLETMSPIP